MNKNVLIILGIIILAGAVAYIADERSKGSGESVPLGMHRMPDGSMMHNADAGPGSGMDHMDMMVSSEREFIEGMIPHHQEAVDTAKEVIERGGTTPEVKTLVEGIIVAQEAEIASMKKWYESWYGTPYADKGTYQPMMRDLENLSGTALDRVFLEDMIMHHMGAIMMARSVTPYIEHQEITDLTRAIVESQSSEIELMKRLITLLPR